MSFFEQVNETIATYRAKLSSTSETARAIDSNYAWSRLFKIARKEGHEQLITSIEAVCQGADCGRGKPHGVAAQRKLGYFKNGNALPVA